MHAVRVIISMIRYFNEIFDPCLSKFYEMTLKVQQKRNIHRTYMINKKKKKKTLYFYCIRPVPLKGGF